jgi:hypothetical protein
VKGKPSRTKDTKMNLLSVIDFRDAMMTGNLVVTIVLGYFVSRIRGLEGDLKSATKEAIEEKLQAIRERQNDHTLRIRELERADQRLEVDVLKAISELKDVVATKDDLQRLREEMQSR